MQSGNEQRAIMQFGIRNNRLGTVVWAGVRAFTAAPGEIILPYWMMSFLQVSERDRVLVSLLTGDELVTATRATFRPEEKEFSELPNTRVILEKVLREHPCLTQGTVIPVPFNERCYHLRVLKLDPAKCASAFRADLATDFAPHISEFSHDWVLDREDSDSSSDTELIEANRPRTLKGVAIPMKDPLRSTVAKREEQRKIAPPPAGVTLYQAGQPIAPPKAAERKVPKKSDAFKGQGRLVRKKKGAEDFPVKTEKPQAPAPLPAAFQGSARTLKDAPAPPKAEDAAAPPAPPAPAGQGKPPPASPFVGTGRTIKDKPPPGAPPQPAPASPKPAPAPPKPPADDPDKPSPFKGTGRKLSNR
jgi:hypothetical protein